MPRRVTSHLSLLQRQMLVWLVAQPTESTEGRIVWRAVETTKPWRGTSAATVSRALRRLEERGLVLRQSSGAGHPTASGWWTSVQQPFSGPTTLAQLIPAGWALAVRLSR